MWVETLKFNVQRSNAMPSTTSSPFLARLVECHLPHLPALRAPFHWLDLMCRAQSTTKRRARGHSEPSRGSSPLAKTIGPPPSPSPYLSFLALKTNVVSNLESSNQKNREAGKRASSCPNGSGRRRKARFRVPQVLSGCDGPAIALAIDRFALNLIGNSQPPVRGGRGTLLPLARRRRRSNTAYLSCLR